MYTIRCTKDSGRVKSHTATTREMAQAICTDLTIRFGEELEIVYNNIKPFYDPGGALMLNQAQFDLGLVQVNAQHTDFMRAHFNQLLARPPRESAAGPYYKIHGNWYCICLTPAEMGLTHAALMMTP